MNFFLQGAEVSDQIQIVSRCVALAIATAVACSVIWISSSNTKYHFLTYLVKFLVIVQIGFVLYAIVFTVKAM